MITPIRLNTAYGNTQFGILYSQFELYQFNEHRRKSFEEVCVQEYRKITDYLKFFLEDDEMTHQFKLDEADKEGWKKYNELSDIASCLLYFSGHKQKEKELNISAN